jgi:hypothetical protein
MSLYWVLVGAGNGCLVASLLGRVGRSCRVARVDWDGGGRLLGLGQGKGWGVNFAVCKMFDKSNVGSELTAGERQARREAKVDPVDAKYPISFQSPCLNEST